jgi:uncharacterized membrane protein
MAEKFNFEKGARAKRRLSERYYSKQTIERINAFIDAVLAIIATIMVLELKLPEVGAHHWASIEPILIGVAIFVISFIVVINQYVSNMRLFNLIHKINPIGLLLVFSWLATLSLLPFFTRWMFEDWHNRFAVLGYGIVYVLASIIQQGLLLNVVRSNFNPDEMDTSENNSLARLYNFAFSNQAKAAAVGSVILLGVATIWPSWGFWLFILFPVFGFIDTIFDGELKDRIYDEQAKFSAQENADLTAALETTGADETPNEVVMDVQEEMLERLFWKRMSPDDRQRAEQRFNRWRDGQLREQARERERNRAEHQHKAQQRRAEQEREKARDRQREHQHH